MTELIQTTLHNSIATLTLNRPQALNALNLEMIVTMQSLLDAWAQDDSVRAVLVTTDSPKGLCAGGDIRYFHTAALAKDPSIDTFFTAEYTLNHTIANYPKPYIVVMQGIVMGGGMGISTHANPATGLRIVTDSSKIAMPEIKIGLFPDVGGTHFLSHCPGEVGTYLALTASVIDAASALYAGLADVYCPTAQLPALQAHLGSTHVATQNAVRQAVIDFCAPFAVNPASSALAMNAKTIERCFAKGTVAEIEQALQSDGSDFATAAQSSMRHGSPLSVHATLVALRRSRSLSLAQALRMERSLVRRFFAHGEPVEGIRALAVDKDHSPKWTHSSLNAVTAEDVNALFISEWTDSEHPLRHLN